MGTMAFDVGGIADKIAAAQADGLIPGGAPAAAADPAAVADPAAGQPAPGAAGAQPVEGQPGPAAVPAAVPGTEAPVGGEATGEQPVPEVASAPDERLTQLESERDQYRDYFKPLGE